MHFHLFVRCHQPEKLWHPHHQPDARGQQMQVAMKTNTKDH